MGRCPRCIEGGRREWFNSDIRYDGSIFDQLLFQRVSLPRRLVMVKVISVNSVTEIAPPSLDAALRVISRSSRRNTSKCAVDNPCPRREITPDLFDPGYRSAANHHFTHLDPSRFERIEQMLARPKQLSLFGHLLWGLFRLVHNVLSLRECRNRPREQLFVKRQARYGKYKPIVRSSKYSHTVQSNQEERVDSLLLPRPLCVVAQSQRADHRRFSRIAREDNAPRPFHPATLRSTAPRLWSETTASEASTSQSVSSMVQRALGIRSPSGGPSWHLAE